MRVPVILCSLLLASASSFADEVLITVSGVVEFNGVSSGPIAAAAPGEPASMSFTVDSDVFVDSPSFPVRGYSVNVDSFVFNLGPASLSLEMPGVETPYFAIRNDDPAVDGFMLTSIVDFPNGVALDVTGSFGAFRDNFYVTYAGSTLSSLDILGAQGTYQFAGLSVYNWTINDGPFEPVGIAFEELTIGGGPPPEVFRRGDANGDGAVDIADAIFTLGALFTPGAPAPTCPDAADSNDDGASDIADAIHVLGYLFQPGAPVPPDPGAATCGPDPTDDALDCVTADTCP